MHKPQTNGSTRFSGWMCFCFDFSSVSTSTVVLDCNKEVIALSGQVFLILVAIVTCDRQGGIGIFLLHGFAADSLSIQDVMESRAENPNTDHSIDQQACKNNGARSQRIGKEREDKNCRDRRCHEVVCINPG